MAFSAEFRQKVESALRLVAPIETRAMFGGVGIYSEELFFAVIASDRLYFKVDANNVADFDQRGMGAFSKGYRELPPDVLEDPEELAVWVAKSISAAERKRPKR